MFCAVLRLIDVAVGKWGLWLPLYAPLESICVFRQPDLTLGCFKKLDF